VLNLLMLACCVGLVAATAALWVQGWRRADHRLFAELVFGRRLGRDRDRTLASYWVLGGTLAVLFALRLYRELQEPPPGERLLSRA
jgi:hypothetical protein